MKLLEFKTSRLNSEQGVTLIEAMLTVLLISLTIMAWLLVVRQVNKGTLISKNNLRAHNLALSKMEVFRNMAVNASYGRNWDQVTKTAMALNMAEFQVARLEDKNFTWRVMSTYVWPSGISTTAVDYETQMVSYTAEVFWTDLSGDSGLTLTAKVTDAR